MITRLLTTVACVTSAVALSAQVTFNGMGDSNGPIGSGTMTLSDDGQDLTIDLYVTTGFNFIPETLVLYVDSQTGGHADNAAFTDNNDGPRIAASGLSGGNQRAPITFPAGFEPDYAIVIENGPTNVFALTAMGTHVFQASASQTKNIGPEGNTANIVTVVPLSSIGNPTEMVFVSTLVFGDGSRTDESHTEPITGGDPGFSPVTFTNTATYNTSVILPVTFARFDAAAEAGDVALAWETATEQDNAGFAVERSRDGGAWTEIAFVEGRGDSRASVTYDYTDSAAPAGVNYYRLRQVDYDGTESFSAIASAVVGMVEEAVLEVVGAHPVHRATRLRNTAPVDVEAALFDATGRRVAAFRIGAGATYRLDVGALASGTYVLQAGGHAQRLMVR